ncbi:hypothetical protein GGI26_003086 [Coemansia sp. RSA 1358]|nr:hypothetical protein GGI26_003086 [Coemansia sp. RSA 1358]
MPPLRHLVSRKTIPAGGALQLNLNGLRAPPTTSLGSALQTPLSSASQTPTSSMPQTPTSSMPQTPQSSAAQTPTSSPQTAVADQDCLVARRAARTYRNGPQLIMPYLYLGGSSNVGAELPALGINHILNVAVEVSKPVESTTYKHVKWDHNEPDLSRYFSECFEFIDRARVQHQGVLVHCQLGVSRSASLVIAYVMRTMDMGFGQAYEYVRLRAPCISPNLSLIAQLSEYGRALQSVPDLTCSGSSSATCSPVESACGPMAHRSLPLLPPKHVVGPTPVGAGANFKDSLNILSHPFLP